MPMKTMIGIQILEMTTNGLQEIVSMETEPMKDPKDWSSSLEVITEKIYNNDKLFMVFEEQAFVVNNISNKTIVIKGVFQPDSCKPGSQA